MPTDEERYLFDLHGYLVVRNVLRSSELAELNRLVDVNGEKKHTPDDPIGWLSPIFTWGQPFRDLLDHPQILPYLKEWIDPSLRADICYGNTMEKGCPGDLHLGGTPYIGVASYHFRNGHPHSAMTVVAWALTDAPPGGGGFGCIPGSHKANYRCPESIMTNYVPDDTLVHVPVKAGDVLIFTEALTHGTIPWQNDFVRRVLFFRYTPGFMRFEPSDHGGSEVLDLMTPNQRQLLEDPYSRRSGEEARPEVAIPERVG